MKKVRFLQIVVYIVFALFFLQNAAGDAYKGFIDGFNDGYDLEDNPKPVELTTVIPSATIDASLMKRYADGKISMPNSYALERVYVNADIRVNSKLMAVPWWLSAFDLIMAFINFFLLLRLSIVINKIIFNIYTCAIFNKKSVALVNQAGVLLIIYAIANYLYQQGSYLKSKYLVNPPFSVLNGSAFSFELLMCGLLVLIVAEAFKQGARLKEEQDLTI